MSKKLPQRFIDTTNEFLESESNIVKYRMSEKDFTRNRKLSFQDLSLCMLKLLRQNIQVELNSYFDVFKQSVSKKPHSFSSSAFVQSRKKLKPDMFYDLSKLISDDFYLDNDENVKLYKGHRLVAIDGSQINLPVNNETRDTYGTYTNQKINNDVVNGRVSIMYDLLNEMVLDGVLCHSKVGEIPLSRLHIPLACKNDIIIMDRGYANFDSMYEMNQRNIHYIFRCQSNFSNVVKTFIGSGKKDAVVTMSPNPNQSFKELSYNKNETIQVRMIRVELSSGESEILITSLLDKTIYPHKDFKALYFKRWGIETYYNRFKNIIGVENFSGTSDQFIQQEFNCALYMSNMQSILTRDAQDEASKKYKDRKYEYKINSSLSLCFIRQRILDIFKDKMNTNEKLEELKTLFVLNVIPVRPNRTFVREPDKFRQRTKPKQFNNRRTNI